MPKTTHNKNPDWYIIKSDYETNETLSVAAIAKKHKINPRRLYARAKKGDWRKPLVRVVNPSLPTDNKSLGIFVQTLIARILREFDSVVEVSEWYKEQRAILLRQSQVSDLAILDAIRNTLTEDSIKKMSENQKARWFEVLGKDLKSRYEEERLEEGESTENVSAIYKYILVMQKEDALNAR